MQWPEGAGMRSKGSEIWVVYRVCKDVRVVKGTFMFPSHQSGSENLRHKILYENESDEIFIK